MKKTTKRGVPPTIRHFFREKTKNTHILGKILHNFQTLIFFGKVFSPKFLLLKTICFFREKHQSVGKP